MNAFDKIIGYAALKKELQQISDTLRNPEAYRQLGVHTPRGLLLHGDPGVGKSLMASAVIEESGRKTYCCRKNEPNGDFVKTIKATFDGAAEDAPCIVFLDDMDKFANGDERHPDAEEFVTVQSCMDTVRDKEVFVLATANNINCLPKSLRRSGRFDRVIEVEVPEGPDAVKIIAHYLEGKQFVADVDAQTIGRLMSGQSCADLETLINEAGLRAGYERTPAITMKHLLDAFLETVLDVPIVEDAIAVTLGSPANTLSQVVYHEAGHAVLSELIRPQSVTLVSTIGKGGEKGFTRCYNDETMPPHLWDHGRILCALGGMAAIDQRFGIFDAGCEDDLDRAFRLARRQIEGTGIYGFHLHGYSCDNSVNLCDRQEQAAAAEVERCYRKAKEILSLNREFLDKLAEALMEKRLLTEADIQEIKGSCTIVPVVL